MTLCREHILELPLAIFRYCRSRFRTLTQVVRPEKHHCLRGAACSGSLFPPMSLAQATAESGIHVRVGVLRIASGHYPWFLTLSFSSLGGAEALVVCQRQEANVGIWLWQVAQILASKINTSTFPTVCVWQWLHLAYLVVLFSPTYRSHGLLWRSLDLKAWTKANADCFWKVWQRMPVEWSYLFHRTWQFPSQKNDWRSSTVLFATGFEHHFKHWPRFRKRKK